LSINACQVWHFLPAMGAKPVGMVMADMAQELIGTARTVIHRFFA
jgi:hypothetical protein